MHLWITENNPKNQTMLAVACTGIGFVLLLAFRDISGTCSNTGAGFLLGILLLVIGVSGFLMSGRQKITVDPVSRNITIEDATLFGRKSRSIPFDHIDDIGIGYLGKKSNFVTIYYLLLKLRSGEEYPLFAPGRFYEGSCDRPTVEVWRQRLYEYLGQHL